MQAHHSIIRGSFSADEMSLKNKKIENINLYSFYFILIDICV